ncbi:hypothetical protein J7M28_02255 [bacterium]|nr:hypothetical protein [bacterium]
MKPGVNTIIAKLSPPLSPGDERDLPVLQLFPIGSIDASLPEYSRQQLFAHVAVMRVGDPGHYTTSLTVNPPPQML